MCGGAIIYAWWSGNLQSDIPRIKCELGTYSGAKFKTKSFRNPYSNPYSS